MAFALGQSPFKAADLIGPPTVPRALREHRSFLLGSLHFAYKLDAPTMLPDRAALMHSSQESGPEEAVVLEALG
jgi:hypothetical protein